MAVFPHCLNHFARKFYPDASSNHTSSTTQVVYLDHVSELIDIERWKPHVKALLTHFQQMPFYESWLQESKFNTTEVAVEAMSRFLKKALVMGIRWLC